MMRFVDQKTHHKNEGIDFYDVFYCFLRENWTKSEKEAPDTSAVPTIHRPQ